MNRTISYVIIISFGAIVVMVALSFPELLSNRNSFLSNFVGPNLLSILGVILAITLASIGQVHLSLNRIEEHYKRRAFHKTRSGLQNAAYWLIALFMICIMAIYLKSTLPQIDWIEAILNGAALLILLWYMLILISIVQMTFAIEADID